MSARHISCAAIAACLSAVLGTAAAPARAQEAPSSATIVGQVRRSVDSLPVALASVTVDSTGAKIQTDSAGRFTFPGISPGPHKLHVQKVGYAPANFDVTVSTTHMSEVVVELEPVPQGLRAVQINGRTIEVLPRYAGIAERASRNHGALFTAEDIRGEVRTKDVLQRLPGVQVNDRSVTFARCQDSGGLPSPFGGTGRETPRVQVYVDGVRLTAEPGEDVRRVLDSVNPSSIALMEVYTGIARLPGEFVNDACAVVAIWTKAY